MYLFAWSVTLSSGSEFISACICTLNLLNNFSLHVVSVSWRLRGDFMELSMWHSATLPVAASHEEFQQQAFAACGLIAVDT